MSDDHSWHAAGQLDFRGSPTELAYALASVGLAAESGHYAVRIKGCSHFVLRCVDKPESGSGYEVDADADSEADMMSAAVAVSEALRAARISHEFEVLNPGNFSVKNFAHNG